MLLIFEILRLIGICVVRETFVLKIILSNSHRLRKYQKVEILIRKRTLMTFNNQEVDSPHDQIVKYFKSNW